MGGESRSGGKRVQTTMGTMKTTLEETTSMNQISFVPKYGKYTGLGSVATNPTLD